MQFTNKLWIPRYNNNTQQGNGNEEQEIKNTKHSMYIKGIK